jgi:hypothetical protein
MVVQENKNQETILPPGLAKSLAHPGMIVIEIVIEIDKKGRTQGVKLLKSWIASVKELSELDLMKLFKALHYCKV